MLRFERERERDRVDVALPQVAHGGPGVLCERQRLEFVPLAEADDQDPLDGQIFGVQQDDVVGLALSPPRRKHVCDRASQFPVDRLGGAVELAVGEDGDDQRARFERRRSSWRDGYLHDEPFNWQKRRRSMDNPDANWPQAETPLRDAYALAGVDISAGNRAVEHYRELTAGWKHPSQLDAIGGFAGLFALPGDATRALVASTDGVGTKTLIAAALRRYETVGADLVKHLVNDILAANAAPLFFLDYLAMGRLDPAVAGAIVSGVQLACRAHEIALLGGETAEMAGMYDVEHFDLAGTIVGIVATSRIPDRARVRAGDAIVGLPAAGLHTH